jgi:hypothetical protein
VDDEQADAMPAAEPPPPAVPNSPDAEPPLTEHEVGIGAAYVYGKRAAVAERPFQRGAKFSSGDCDDDSIVRCSTVRPC